MKRTLILALGLTLGGSASAFTFNDVRAWYGTGEHRAGLVLQWNDGAEPQALAFGFRFDGPATGADMLLSIAQADPRLTVNAQEFSFGIFITQIAFEGRFGSGSPDAFWQYWTQPIPGDQLTGWASSNVGASDRPLSDGSWDAWQFGEFGLPAPSVTPVAAEPIPEPATLLALALGAGLLARRRRPR